MSAVSSTFLSTLRQALKEERHFALVEICQAKLGLAGRALTFVHNTTGNTQNVYMQPLAGGAAVQLTHSIRSQVRYLPMPGHGMARNSPSPALATTIPM